MRFSLLGNETSCKKVVKLRCLEGFGQKLKWADDLCSWHWPGAAFFDIAARQSRNWEGRKQK